MKALVLFSAPVVALLLLLLGVVVILVPVAAPPVLTSAGCVPTVPGGGVSGVRLDAQQLGVAAAVVRVGQQTHVPARGWVVALAAGLQESGLRPLSYGDRDSIGVFQQRAAWASYADRINPTTAARMFFTGGHGGQRGLTGIPGWQTMPIGRAAQAVQVSAYPDAYAKWEQLATQLVHRVAHVDPTSCDGPATSGGSGRWTFPLGNASYVMTAGFGECGTHWTNCHTGQDFAVPTGTPVMSAGDGTVVFAGWAGPYGYAVRVFHAGGVATWYCHLSRLETQRGAQVAAGRVIGLSGSTGNTTGPHLHLEVRLGASPIATGTPVNPLPWLRQRHLL
ncbi:hypothetical protein GCM10027596_31790 [Nocardioides korecus]